MTTDFSILSSPAFWLAFAGLLLLVYSVAVLRNLRDITFNRQRDRFIALFIVAAGFAFSVALLGPFIESAFDAVIAADQSSEITLFAYSLIATLLVTYSLNVINNFERREKDLTTQIVQLNQVAQNLQSSEKQVTERIDSLSTVSKSLMDAEQRHDRLLKSVLLVGQLSLSRTSSFFHLINQVNELPLDTVIEDDALRIVYMDLKLLQIAIGRDDIDELCFDLEELKTIAQVGPERIKKHVIKPISDYFVNLVKYQEDIQEDITKVERLKALVDVIFR